MFIQINVNIVVKTSRDSSVKRLKICLSNEFYLLADRSTDTAPRSADGQVGIPGRLSGLAKLSQEVS